MKEAILEAFVGLTEHPLIYELIATDPGYAPTNARQSFRNEKGEIVAPGSPGFDLSPMAKRPGGYAVQFTDFTLEGSMNPDTVYFYLARELGNRMQLGDPSPVFGPVKLVNLKPPAGAQGEEDRIRALRQGHDADRRCGSSCCRRPRPIPSPG